MSRIGRPKIQPFHVLLILSILFQFLHCTYADTFSDAGQNGIQNNSVQQLNNISNIEEIPYNGLNDDFDGNEIMNKNVPDSNTNSKSITEELPFYPFTDEDKIRAKKFHVPNIIHFIRFHRFELNFVEYVVLLAAMRNHRPKQFYFHTNVPNANFTGKYWELVMRDRDLAVRLNILHLKVPNRIFRQPLSTSWQDRLGSHIARIQVLMKYGGIYLDNDIYVIDSLDKYRMHEITIDWPEHDFPGNQVILAHKGARFLPKWLESFKIHGKDSWYHYGGDRQTTEVLIKNPELIHRVKGVLGAPSYASLKIYSDVGFNWRQRDVINLFINQRHIIDPNYKNYPEFNETVIGNYTYPFGDMVRDVIGTTTKLIP